MTNVFSGQNHFSNYLFSEKLTGDSMKYNYTKHDNTLLENLFRGKTNVGLGLNV